MPRTDPSVLQDPWTDPDATETDLWYAWYRQPTKTQLVAAGFRGRFARGLESARKVWEMEEEERRVLGRRRVEREVRRLRRMEMEQGRELEREVQDVHVDAQVDEVDADASPPVFSESFTETETEVETENETGMEMDTPASTFGVDDTVAGSLLRATVSSSPGAMQIPVPSCAPVRAAPRRRVVPVAMASSCEVRSTRGWVRTRLDAVAEEDVEGDYPVW